MVGSIRFGKVSGETEILRTSGKINVNILTDSNVKLNQEITNLDVSFSEVKIEIDSQILQTLSAFISSHTSNEQPSDVKRDILVDSQLSWLKKESEKAIAGGQEFHRLTEKLIEVKNSFYCLR
jgi:hypothetical protein